MWQSGSSRFHQVFLRKGTGGGSATAPSSGESSDSVSSVSHSRLSNSLRRCAIRVFLQWCHTVSRAQILHVAGYSVHQDGLWTNHLGHPTFCRILWYIDSVPSWTTHDLVIAVSETWRHYWGINSLYLHLIIIDLVGGSGRRWYVVSGCSIVPVDSLLDWTVHSGCNTLHRVVTLLCYAIPSWDIHATKQQVNSLIICKPWTPYCRRLCHYL